MSKHITNFFKRWKYESAIFVFLMISGMYISTSFFHVAHWPFAFYLLDYNVGSGSRLLIGSIFNFIFKGFLNFPLVGLIVFCFLSFLCFIISIFLGRLLRFSDKIGNNTGLIFLVLMYLASPGRISQYFAYNLIGYFEIYLFALVLLMIYIFLNHKQNCFFWFTISALCILSMAIHQVFIFIMFPIMLSLMIYNLYEKKWEKSILLGTIFVCIVTVISFLYFQFFSRLNVHTLNELVSIVIHKTNLYYPVEALKIPYKCEYFDSTKEKLIGTMLYAIKNLFKPIFLILVCFFLLPIFSVLNSIWKNIYKNCNDKSEKIIFVLMQSCGLAFLPAFILACDWGRWFFWYLTFQFILLFILYWKESKPAVLAINTLGEFVHNNKFIMGLLLLYLMIFYIDIFNIIAGFQLFNKS